MKLSTQLDPIHWGPTHERLIHNWQPKSIRIINPDQNRIQRILSASPNSLLILREHGPSEDHGGMMRNPAGLGEEHALMWANKLEQWRWSGNTDQLCFLGINEPHVWDEGVIDALNIYTIAFLASLNDYGLRGGALSLSVGWPANTGKDTPPDWEPYTPTIDYLEAHRQHFLMLHEYWCKEGPRITEDLRPDLDGGPWGWTAGRHVQLSADVPIIIGECGLEQVVCSGNLPSWQRGWRAYYGDRPEIYTAQLLQYESAIQADPRIHSAQIYILDGNTADWGSLYYEPQIPAFGRNTDHNWYVDSTPPPSDDLDDAVRSAAKAQQCISLNPHAALQRAILTDQLWPVGNEATVIHGGTTYICQRAEDPYAGRGYTYYVAAGDWANVDSVPDV